MQRLKHTIEVIFYDERRHSAPVKSLGAWRVPAPWLFGVLFEVSMVVGYIQSVFYRIAAAFADIGMGLIRLVRRAKRAAWMTTQALAQAVGLILVVVGLIEKTFGLIYLSLFFSNLGGELCSSAKRRI